MPTISASDFPAEDGRCRTSALQGDAEDEFCQRGLQGACEGLFLLYLSDNKGDGLRTFTTLVLFIERAGCLS